jgi:hypothetical protein
MPGEVQRSSEARPRGRDLPRSRRQELLGEIHEHIDSALAESPAHDEAEVRNVLDRLGDPADIAEEARRRFGVPRERSRGLEIAVPRLSLKEVQASRSYGLPCQRGLLRSRTRGTICLLP